MKPVRVLLKDILRKSQEGTTADMLPMLPETIVENCDIKSHMHTHTGEKPFTCSQGNKSSKPSSPQANYEDSESPRELYPGPNCDKAVTKKNIKLSENAKKPYTCSLCNKSFTENDTLIIHMLTHSKEKNFTCDLCSKPFLVNSKLTRHMRIHTGEKPFSCMICNKRFVQNSHVKSHMQTHTREKLFSCSQCNKSYSNRCSLKIHIKSHTSKNTSLGLIDIVEKQSRLCLADNCKFESKLPNDNGQIEQEPKENKTTLACSICMQSFSKYYRLKNHVKKHTMEKQFTCTVCSKPFSEKSKLIAHLRIHSGEKPFSCLICKMLFSDGSNMKTHMRTHSGERPFSCSNCNKSFSRRSHLKVHSLRHTRDTREMFSCSHCSKSYLLKDSLRKHMLSHTREKFP